MSGNELPMEIDVRGVKQKLDAGDDFLLLDCRDENEHALVCIDEATLVPMSELVDRVSELEPFRAKNIVVHCHHGGRSLRVASWLREQGFSQAQSMAGGIDQWAELIEPSMARY